MSACGWSRSVVNCGDVDRERSDYRVDAAACSAAIVLYCDRDDGAAAGNRYRHTFPTRRSSDLGVIDRRIRDQRQVVRGCGDRERLRFAATGGDAWMGRAHVCTLVTQ